MNHQLLKKNQSAKWPAVTALLISSISLVTSLGVAAQDSISVNFGSDRRAVNNSSLYAGAVDVLGSNWNNASGGSGTLTGLVDANGNATTASVIWSSNNTYLSGSSGETATSENGDLTKGYLDDGGAGWAVTLNSPFLLNDIYIIHGTDQGGSTSQSVNLAAVSVNGTYYEGDGIGGTVLASGASDTWSAINWTNADTLVESDNYLKIEGQGPVVLAADRNGARAAISGVQVVNAYSGTLSYWDTNGATAGSGDAGGTWGTDNFWTASETGETATGSWTSGNAAVFSAGDDGTGMHTITLSADQTADAVWAKDGNITLTGSVLNLTGNAILRGDQSLTVDSQLSSTDLQTHGNVTLNNSSNSITGTASVYGVTTLGSDQSFGGLAGAGELALGVNQLTLGGSDADTTFGGRFSGTGTLVKSGTGKLSLTGDSSGYAGTTTISSGTLNIGGGGKTGNLAGNITNNSVLEVHRTNTIGFGSNVSGTGDFKLLGDGTSNSQINLTGDNSGFSGAVSVDGARVNVNMSGGNRLGTGAVTVKDGGQLWITGGTVANNLFLNGNGTTEGSGQLGAVRLENGTTVSGTVTLQSDSRMTTWSGSTAKVTGAITGAYDFEKTGAGTLIIESTGNTGLSGKTLVSGGILRIADQTSLGATPGTAQADDIVLSGGGKLMGGTSSGSNITLDANRGVTISGGESGFHVWTGFDMTVQGDITGAGSLAKSDGGALIVNGDVDVDGRFTISGGTATFNGDADFGNDLYVQNGSTVRYNGSVLNAAGGINGRRGTTYINLGNGAGGSGVLEDIELGNASGQGHTVHHSAGDLTVTNDIRIGHYGSETSVYNQSGGTVTQADTVTSPTNEGQANLFLGIDGTGEYHLSGGTLNTTSLVMDGRGNTSGTDTFTLTGGNLNIGKWGIRSGNTGGTYLIQLGGGTVGTTSSDATHDWSAGWSSNLNMELTGTNGDVTFDTGGNDVALTGVLSGSGGLIKTGAGSLVLGGTNTYTGTTDVNAGKLHVAGNASKVTVNSGAVLQGGTVAAGGVGTMDTLTLTDGSLSTFRVGGSSVDRIDITGTDGFTVAAGGTHTATIAPAGQLSINDEFVLFDYEGSIQGAGVAGISAQLPNPHYGFTVSDDAVNTQVKLTVNSVDAVIWTGAGGQTWDENNTTSWKTESDGLASNFYEYDVVKFNNDSPSGTVSLTGTITPASVEVASANNHTFAGSGIEGAGSLTKSGTGTLTLLNDNSFTGSVDIQEGSVVVGDGGTTGTLGGSGAIALEGSLTFNRSDQTDMGRAITGNGTLVVDGGGTLRTTAGGTSMPNQVTVQGGSVLQFASGAFGGNRMTGAGVVTVENGSTMRITAAHGFGGYPGNSDSIVLNGGVLEFASENYIGKLTMNGGQVTGTNELRAGNNNDIQVTGSTASSIASARMNLVYNANVTVEDVTSDAGVDLTVSAVVNGSGALVKSGAGTMLLEATNGYSGTTNINAGMLALGVSGSIHQSSSINVAAGAQFDVSAVSGGFELQDGQKLGGAGQVLGPIELAQGSVLAPGSSAGTLTLNSSLMLGTGSFLDFELSGSDQTTGSNINDLVAGITDLTLDGTLNVTELVTNDFLNAQSGDRWVLMEYTGVLTDNGLDLGTLPTLTAGLDFELDITTGGQVALTVIPEPSTFTLFGLGAFALILRRKR
ncbi:autotransporter-associated beta strand repeat-containing protein [Verrucomicrobiaceae bacterium N1E253]|uniref:Autotransporter-associated beta strand repeat-containing protein n=1 Tax=Oceaniferula marina TaxID=2748318 RepID=A0A851GG73_9BACT|nr:autotransporter-associated beta strand repeat-containing protein [Oceaniferula marina]NWK56513.1 autotransporter-associated beta strand repeat-containing protein [Oceaniferula marina]